MKRLAERARQDEQMDAPDLDPAIYGQVLHDLARVNRWTFTAWPAIAFLQRAVRPGASFSLLDVGFGDGDILRVIARWARKRGLTPHLVGVDLNHKSLSVARSVTPDDLLIDYRIGDYRDQPEQFDFIISSQVTHHMSDDQLMMFLQHMEARAERGWLVCDLHRHGFAYHAYPLLARLLRVHHIVREDGQLSIARSFRRDEWRDWMQQAGICLDDVRIVRRFAFRLCVERLRSC